MLFKRVIKHIIAPNPFKYAKKKVQFLKLHPFFYIYQNLRLILEYKFVSLPVDDDRMFPVHFLGKNIF